MFSANSSFNSRINLKLTNQNKRRSASNKKEISKNKSSLSNQGEIILGSFSSNLAVTQHQKQPTGLITEDDKLGSIPTAIDKDPLSPSAPTKLRIDELIGNISFSQQRIKDGKVPT